MTQSLETPVNTEGEGSPAERTCPCLLPFSGSALTSGSPRPPTHKISCYLSLENVSKSDGFAHSGDFIFLGLSHVYTLFSFCSFSSH